MKKAFTLSEVLITLGIIGVVAALTIPTVVKNYRYKMYSTQLQKTYSQIQTAIDTIMQDELTDDFYKTTGGAKNDSNCQKGPCYFLTKYFKLARTNCGEGSSSKKCIADDYTWVKGNNSGSAGKMGGYCAQTINGAAICITNNSINGVTTIFLDTNGLDEPNTVGLDTFVMDFRSDGKLRDWSDNPDNCGVNTKGKDEEGNDKVYGHIGDYAPGCLTKAINNGWVIKD